MSADVILKAVEPNWKIVSRKKLSFKPLNSNSTNKCWIFAKVVAHIHQYETFCCKFHIWSGRRFQKYIGILAVMLDKATKRSNLTKNNKLMHVESHSQNRNDQKKKLYSRQTEVIAHFRGVIHATNSTYDSWIWTRVWSKWSWCPAKGAMSFLQKL